MELGEDGKYYFDVETKKELKLKLFNDIIEILIKGTESIYTKTICGKKFYFEMKGSFSYIYTQPENKTEISTFPIEIKFKSKIGAELRIIFSLEQFNKTLDYFDIKFAWSKDLVLHKNNLINLIYYNVIVNDLIKVEDIDVFNIKLSDENENGTITELKKNITKLEDLSKYISYYMKKSIDLYKYEEMDFIKEKDYNIKPDSKFKIFDIINRMKLWFTFNNLLDKEFFFTGPNSIGKSFSLLLFSNYDIKNVRKAYFNLEALNKFNAKYFEILAYEARHLFNDNESWKKEFLKIKEANIEGPFSIIKFLIESVSRNKESKTKYIFILDQIKIKGINEDIEYQRINAIRKIIKNTKNCYLIGCCSINYKAVKDILFETWFSINNTIDLKLNYICMPKEKNNENLEDNKFLELLGNLPRILSIKDLLNKKIINILTKKIKEKIEKFYNKDKFLSISELKKLKINQPFEDKNAFKSFLDRIPFKFFLIDIKKRTVDYAYPLVKTAISELLETYNLKNFKCNNEAERGWIFERKIIDTIKTTHIFGDIYIDNYFEIPTLFRKYKIEDKYFDLSENTLFYFKYFNVLRYNCAIYLSEMKIFLLLQISKLKSETQLKKYNKDNFQKDLDGIQKFIKINKLDVKNYFLLFVLDEDNYRKSENCKVIEKFNLKYCLYNSDKNCFFGYPKNFNKIDYSKKNKINLNDEDAKLFEFGIRDNSFIYDSIQGIFSLYAEKGMTFKDFIEQTLEENVIEKFREFIKIEEEQYLLSKIYYLITKNYKEDLFETKDKTNILFFNLSNNIIYLGKGKIKEGRCKLTFQSFEYFGSFSKCNKMQNIDSMTGFIFKTN